MSYLLVYLISIIALDIIYNGAGNDDVKPVSETGYIIYNAILRTFKFLFDIYLFCMFIRLYFYFFGMMQVKLALKKGKLSSFNKAIFIWGLFLAFVSFCQSLLVLLTGFIIGKEMIVTMNRIVMVCDRHIIPIKDFLVFSTMLYLF